MGDDWNWPKSRNQQRRYFDRLRPKPDEIREARSALGKIVFVCHQKSGLHNVDRVTTCGSMGKKTASSHKKDLDLVVYLDGLSPNDMKSAFPRILDAIQNAIDTQYPGTRDTKWYRKFGLRYVIEGLEIDILIGAKGVMPLDFLQIADAEQRAYMSSSVSHLATRFMKQQTIMFQDLVRLAKHWRDSFSSWPPQCEPKSYLLEVIMLEACRRMGFCSRKGYIHLRVYSNKVIENTLVRFFELIAAAGSIKSQNYDKDNLPPLFVYFTKYYSKQDLPLTHPEPIFQLSRKGYKGKVKTRKATAIVMDPCNPTNNLWLTLGDPTSLVDRASATAQQIANGGY